MRPRSLGPTPIYNGALVSLILSVSDTPHHYPYLYPYRYPYCYPCYCPYHYPYLCRCRYPYQTVRDLPAGAPARTRGTT